MLNFHGVLDLRVANQLKACYFTDFGDRLDIYCLVELFSICNCENTLVFDPVIDFLTGLALATIVPTLMARLKHNSNRLLVYAAYYLGCELEIFLIFFVNAL